MLDWQVLSLPQNVSCCLIFSPGRRVPMLTPKLVFPCPLPCPALRWQQHLPAMIPCTHGTNSVPCSVWFSHIPQTRDFLSSCHILLAQMDWFNLVLMTKPRFSSLFSFLTDKSTDNIQLSFCYFLSSRRCDSPAHVALASSLQEAVVPSPWPTAPPQRSPSLSQWGHWGKHSPGQPRWICASP